MQKLEFSYNWNKKLDCKAFTTIRLYNPDRYFVGQQFELTLKGIVIGKAKVVAVKSFLLSKLTEYMAYIDTGYSLEECMGIIRRMYPQVDLETQPFHFVLLLKLTP